MSLWSRSTGPRSSDSQSGSISPRAPRAALGRPDEAGDRGPPGRAHPGGPRPLVRADRHAPGRPRRGAHRARDLSRDARRRAARRRLHLRAGQPRRRRAPPRSGEEEGRRPESPVLSPSTLARGSSRSSPMGRWWPNCTAITQDDQWAARYERRLLVRPGLGGDRCGKSSPGISGRERFEAIAMRRDSRQIARVLLVRHVAVLACDGLWDGETVVSPTRRGDWLGTSRTRVRIVS